MIEKNYIESVVVISDSLLNLRLDKLETRQKEKIILVVLSSIFISYF